MSPRCNECGHFGQKWNPTLTGKKPCWHPDHSGIYMSALPFDLVCFRFAPLGTLNGELAANRIARRRLELALRIYCGELTGTINDPRIDTGPPVKKGRKAK